MAFLPLAGRRVLSLAQQLPGPYCGLLLAELGADVVLVEQIPGGDPARIFPALFASANRGKRSVALDLKNPAGRAAFDQLVATADAVLEGKSNTIQEIVASGDEFVEVADEASA